MIYRRIVLLLAAVSIIISLTLTLPSVRAQFQAHGRVPGYENLNPLTPDGKVVPRKAIPRATDGKPDFTGVWAGPGFAHEVGRTTSITHALRG